jgi:hypothetical protein
MMLCTSAFAGENDGKDKKGTTSNASSSSVLENGTSHMRYIWANPTLCGTCSKTPGADAGQIKFTQPGFAALPHLLEVILPKIVQPEIKHAAPAR